MNLNREIIVPPALITAISNFMAEYQFIIGLVIAFGVVTCLLALLILFLRLSANGDNPYLRPVIIKEILVVGVCLSVFGGFSVIIFYFYAFFV